MKKASEYPFKKNRNVKEIQAVVDEAKSEIKKIGKSNQKFEI